MAQRFLPYGRHSIEEDDIAAVVDALRSDWLTTGPKVEAFEQAFPRQVGGTYATVCNSGTAALHLAAAALELGSGRNAIVPSITFVATANVMRYVGAEVVFADVDPDTGLTNARLLDAAAGRHNQSIAAAFVVHMNGHLVEMESVAQLAEIRGWSIVEDACHALGASYTCNGRVFPVGACAHSTMTAFSLHPAKNIAMGEGGMLTTNDAGLNSRAKLLRGHGLTREPTHFSQPDMGFEDGRSNPWYYELQELGWNYRASDINCALGMSQLNKLARFTSRRRELADLYDRLLMPLAPLVTPVPRPVHQQGGWHLYPILADFAAMGRKRAQVMEFLRGRGIGTQVHYIPVHRQPYYRARYGDISLPGADAYYARCLSLPLFPQMTNFEVEYVVEAVAESLGAEV